MKKGEATTTTPTHESSNNTHTSTNSQSHVIQLLYAEVFSYKKAFIAKELADEAVRNHNMILYAVRELKHQLLQIKGSESTDSQIKRIESLIGVRDE